MQLSDEEKSIVEKIFPMAASGLIAILGKFSAEILFNRVLSIGQTLAIVGVSLFCGFMAGLYCYYKSYDHVTSSFVVGICTFLGEKIVVYISKNYKTILERIFNVKAKK